MGDFLENLIIECRIILESLFFTFLILKLTGVISWSWIWVCMPIIVPSIIALLLIALFLILNGVRKNKKEIQHDEQ